MSDIIAQIEGITLSGDAQLSTHEEVRKVEPANGVFVFDTSGSMADTIEQAIKSFNTEILASQKKLYEGAQDVNGEVPPEELFMVTIVQFSGHNNIKVVLQDVPINEIAPIPQYSLVADGLTALRTTIITVDALLSKLKYPNRKTMIFYFTDGDDTDSPSCDSHAVVKTIFERYEKSQTENPKCSISATLVGSNQDAVVTGHSLGLKKSSALSYQDDAVGSAMTSVGRILSRVATGSDQTPTVTETERLESCPSSGHQSSFGDYEII